MAFDRTKFARSSAHANADVPVMWNYKTTDTLATVNTAGYFNSVAKEVNVGDLIYAFTDTGGTPTPAHFFVNANSGTVVDVADGNALTLTDTD